MAVLVILATLWRTGVRADEHCAPIAGGSEALAAIDPTARLAYVQRRLNEDAARVRIWAWSWAGIYSGLVVFNAVRLGQAGSRDAVIDSAVATSATLFGLSVLAIMPPAVLRDQARLARIVARAGGDADTCALVAEAEKILLRDAASEAFGRGPLVHAGSFVFNIGLGLLLGVGFGHWSNGAIVSTTGIAVAELQQVTIRTRIGETLASYRRGQLSAARATTPIAWTLVPTIDPTQMGLQLHVAF